MLFYFNFYILEDEETSKGESENFFSLASSQGVRVSNSPV